MQTIRILLGDDHTLVRQALKRVLEDREGWQVVAEAGDGREAVRLAVQEAPDVAILDVAMPVMNGFDAAKELAKRVPQVRVLMLTMYGDDISVRRALHAGARGYLVKNSADADLTAAISALAAGEVYFSPAVARVMLNDYVGRLEGTPPHDSIDSLSTREREVFQLVAEGKTNRQIAELLEIRPTTVETHRSRVLQKLNLHSAAELVLCAARQRIIA